MTGKHERRTGHAIRGRHCLTALPLVFTLLCTMTPSYVFAADAEPREIFGTSEYLCGHLHDENCGYSEGSPGSPCGHEHDESCYLQVLNCQHQCDHVCTHECGEDCYVEMNTCQHLCGDECVEGCTHICDESCYIVEPQCIHLCDESCYTMEHQCSHSCDESCGYVEPVPSTPCLHICNILSFEDNIPGVPYATCEAVDGSVYEDICAALPQTLEGLLECAEGVVEIPVSWACVDYSNAPGTYFFTAEPLNQNCFYSAVDCPETPELDESALPFIAVTVPQPEPSPTPALEQQSITDAAGKVSVSGLLPVGAYLRVEEVPVETAQELLGSTEKTIVFAFDIKIMTGGALDQETGLMTGGEEYQPGTENPVTVMITPPPETPIVSQVEVVHIAEDAYTGEVTASTITAVNTTLTDEATAQSGAVEFETKGFSIFVVTMGTYTPRVTFSYGRRR